MKKSLGFSALYKNTPSSEAVVEGNSFTNMILKTKENASNTFDKLAYMAGIKSAPADDKFSKLNTTNLSDLLNSAKKEGYDVEVVNI